MISILTGYCTLYSYIIVLYTTAETESWCYTKLCPPGVSPANMASAVCTRFLLQRSTHGFLFSSRTRPTFFRYFSNFLYLLSLCQFFSCCQYLACNVVFQVLSSDLNIRQEHVTAVLVLFVILLIFFIYLEYLLKYV